MSIQVWRPEYERPGRHFVYTTRYVYFFVNLLDQLDDRAGLDQLLRRVRKKQGDFINHPKLWEDICLTYGRIIRRAGDIKEGHEEGIFKPISWDEFVANTARLENLSEFSPQSSTLLELLRDSIELKKLNNNLMKVSLLEDLIADLYSRLYELNLPQLMEQVSEENKEKMKVDRLLMTTNDGPTENNPTPPASGPALAPAGVPTSEAPTAPPRGRTKGIARRDVQKRAETIVASKVSARALNTKPAATNAEAEPSQSFNTAATSSTTVPAKEDKDLAASHEDREGEGEGEGVEPEPESVSMHQSMENEGELSDIDDDKLTKLDTERASRLKPSSPGAEPGSEVSISASFEHDAGGEGEGEGEGEAPATGEAEAEVEAEKEGDEDLGEGEGEGDTLMADEGYEETENAAAGDETELVEVEEDGDEGEAEGEGEGEEGDEEGGGEGEIDGEDEGEGEGEGEGETELLQEIEGAEAEDEPEGGGEGGEAEDETEQATGPDSTQEGDNMNIDERAPEPESMDT